MNIILIVIEDYSSSSYIYKYGNPFKRRQEVGGSGGTNNYLCVHIELTHNKLVKTGFKKWKIEIV